VTPRLMTSSSLTTSAFSVLTQVITLSVLLVTFSAYIIVVIITVITKPTKFGILSRSLCVMIPSRCCRRGVAAILTVTLGFLLYRSLLQKWCSVIVIVLIVLIISFVITLNIEMKIISKRCGKNTTYSFATSIQTLNRGCTRSIQYPR